MRKRTVRHIHLLIGLLSCLALAPVSVRAAGQGASRMGEASSVPEVGTVPAELRETLDLGPFYQKCLSIDGFPVLGSTNASDAALREAAWILQHMMAYRPEILGVMATNRGRLVVMAYNEYTTDIPEQADMTPKVFWDRRARGLGGRLTSCAEENLLAYPNDPYSRENILIHEFAHAIMGVGMRSMDPTFSRRVREAHREAVDAGLWEGTYAGSNPNEYWAEGVQSWFDDNRENDAIHNHVNTRAELKEYDPGLAALCAEVFGDLEWRYRKPLDRPASERTHLTDFDPISAPWFKWRVAPLPDKPTVLIQTDLGDIEAELYARLAPVAVSNFLHQALEGYYRGGEFFRVGGEANAVEAGAGTGFIQARLNPDEVGEFRRALHLVDLADSGMELVDGSLSLACTDTGAVREGFSIVILEPGGAASEEPREMEGRLCFPFGRVIKGMDVVRQIHQMPAEGQQLKTPIRIQNAYRLE